MKLRPLFHSGAWLFSGLLLVTCLATGFYVLMAAAEPVPPPSATAAPGKTYLTAAEVQMKGTPGDEDEDGIPGEDMAPMVPDLSRSDNRLKQSNIRFGKEHVALPMLASPNLTPGHSGGDSGKVYGPEASNPVPYPDPDNASPEELNAQREQQRADREQRRYDSLNERIEKLEERLTKVKSENPSDEQVDRLQKSIERLQKRREDLKREMDSRGAGGGATPEVY